ncbi:hypothetical protein F5I97DRAFT_1807520 [Phlebopus sp. FC_14]|nr:hypothetical protein F5I97DRAFT_1807520 [Phlebopus sp. FC_14]
MPLPRLPTELWRQIFSLIIRKPGVLLADRVDPFSELRERDMYWSQKLPTRSTLLLVCKEWHAIVIELVHEYLHLAYPRQVAVLASRLERSKTDDGQRALGSLTRRIDVRMHNPTPRDFRNISRVLRCTPNLEIYVNANLHMTFTSTIQALHPVTQTSSEIVEALMNTCARSLRRVEWSCNESPSWDDLMDLLRGLRGLQSLTLANIHGSFPERPRTEHLILPSLKTFILGDSPSFSHASLGNVPLNTLLKMLSESSDQLPCLQRLEGFSPFSPDFLRTHGHKIRIVQTVAYTPLLPEIIAKCPNLETFITIFPHQQLDLLSHTSLKHIGIFPISEDRGGVPPQLYNAYIMKPLDDLMNQIEDSYLPNLVQIRIKNIGTLAGVVGFPIFVQKWWAHWNARGVRFDDKDGKSFQMSISGASDSTALHDRAI